MRAYSIEKYKMLNSNCITGNQHLGHMHIA